MGAKKLTPGYFRDDFDVTTTGVDNKRGSVVKTSSVAIHAANDKPGTCVWVGLKIYKSQKLLGLTVGGKEWFTANTRTDSGAQVAFKELFKSVTKSSEQWVVFAVDHAELPTPGNSLNFQVDTRLELDQHVVEYPDAQAITICVCYVPGTGVLKRSQMLVGHSLLQAPPSAKRKVKPA